MKTLEALHRFGKCLITLFRTAILFALRESVSAIFYSCWHRRDRERPLPPPPAIRIRGHFLLPGKTSAMHRPVYLFGPEPSIATGLLPWTANGELQPVGQLPPVRGANGSHRASQFRGCREVDGHIPVGVRFRPSGSHRMLMGLSTRWALRTSPPDTVNAKSLRAL